jgi:large exoprotein involved in heme utilization and adhesion
MRKFLAMLAWGAIGLSQGAIAQVSPDTTLPTNSVVTSNNDEFTVTGGTQIGRNLFHSFQQFSIPTNGFAFFDNAATVRNIISRVTGASPSESLKRMDLPMFS